MAMAAEASSAMISSSIRFSHERVGGRSFELRRGAAASTFRSEGFRRQGFRSFGLGSGGAAVSFLCSGSIRKSAILPARKRIKFQRGFDELESSAASSIACRASSVDNDASFVASDVGFPSDYDELLSQAKTATELALRDNKQLLEIEFPTAGLESVPGDGEGGIEMTGSMQLIREFCNRLIPGEKARRTRIFFPEANEVDFARKSVFGGSSLNLDYLTKPSLFEDFGFTTKVKMSDRVKPSDEMFLVAYPYFNVNEMLVVEELYKEAVMNRERKLVIFNGELDRIRTGYYPSFFYPKLGELAKNFLPKIDTIYYIHNFKGRNGGVLFRSYPGPWKVLRKVKSGYLCLHQQDKMPSLKEVALDILPSL